MMDVYKRYTTHRTTEVMVLIDSTQKRNHCNYMLSALVRKFEVEITDINENSEPILETIYTVLCSLFQRSTDRAAYPTNATLLQEACSVFQKISLYDIKKVLCTKALNAKTLSLLLDIFVLRLSLYSEIDIPEEDWQALIDTQILCLQDSAMDILNIKLTNCYMDKLLLRQSCRLAIQPFYIKTLATAFLRQLKRFWLKLENRREGLLLILLLPKLIKVTENCTKITEEIWRGILSLASEPTIFLTTLCLTADIWFPTSSEYNKQLVDQTVEESLWLGLLNGLSSPDPCQRKQALYLIKRIVDFTDKHKGQGLELSQSELIRPLISTGNTSVQMAFKQNLNNYILTLEALEEKQKHLVTPVFPLLKALLVGTSDQENSQAGLHIAWIRCALGRMLQHDNNAVVKWSLQNVLALDPRLYDDEFLGKVLNVLNTTWLYESDVDDGEPTVVSELAQLLSNAEIKNSDLVTRFIVKASKITWGPVALFYVIHALSIVKKSSSTWKRDELEAVKSLAEINLTMHCRILRIGSQIELLETMTHFATESLDLVAIANTLSAFSTSEALIRGQLAWKRTTAWLSRIVTREQALHFLEHICLEITNKNGQGGLSMKTFSLMIILLYDGQIILDSKSCSGFTTLRNLLHCLIGADSRPYGNAGWRIASVELICNLMDMTSSTDCVLRELISNYADASLRYVLKNLRKISIDTAVDNINTYVSLTEQFFTAANSIISKREVLNHMERFQIESWSIIDDGEDSHSAQRFFGIKILYPCLKATSTKLRNYIFIYPLYVNYKTFMKKSPEAAERCNDSRNPTGKIAAEYYKYVAGLFSEYVRDNSADEWIEEIDWIEQASYLMQVGGKDICKPVVEILSQIFYKEAVKPSDINNFKSVIKLCWNSTLESNECRLATEEIMDLIFSSPFLECSETRELTIECTHEMVSKVDRIPELSITLLKGLKYVKGEYMSNFYEAIVACLLYGTVLRRDQKIELRARFFVLNCYQEVYPNYFTDMNSNTGAATRAFAAVLLHQMITDSPAHAAQLLPLLVNKLNESQNKRYFGDSQIHLLKNRTMQVLLLLQPILENDDIESLHALMCQNVLSESSQPSIRTMQEWLLIRIYLKSNTLRAKLWDLISQGKEQRVGSLCSILSIVYHVAKLISLDLQPDFINHALKHILPCCMAQQFNVRLYAQVIAFKLYNLASELSYTTITEKYRELYTALTESLKHRNLMKNSTKLLVDFYFTIFNPIDDYSLQTLYYELPRLSNVSLDELISAQTFEKFGFKESNSHPLKLLNPTSDMSESQVSAHVLKYSGSAGPIADETDSSGDCSGDMQKKYIPWRSMMPNEDVLNEMSKAVPSRQNALSERGNIILVASLIDKLPNLGGLSRTCEILGVEEFVLASIKQTEDKEFQSLSVSAEKMITLTEVKPHQLQHYLLEKKDSGYRLVGAEQTVNSTNLMDMKFNKKTVLVLGNEKAGMPANLIPLLDECVEIPQVGVVRSLNVHVTGAICLWEYFKQHHST